MKSNSEPDTDTPPAWRLDLSAWDFNPTAWDLDEWKLPDCWQ